MDYDNLKKKMDEVNKREIPEEVRRKMEEDFEVGHTRAVGEQPYQRRGQGDPRSA